MTRADGASARVVASLALAVATLLVANAITFSARYGAHAASAPVRGSSGVSSGVLDPMLSRTSSGSGTKTTSSRARSVTASSRVRPIPLELVVSVDPLCVTRGQPGRVVVKTHVGANLALVLVWPEGDFRENYYLGPVGPDGSFVMPFVVPLDVAAGQGQVWADVHHQALQRGNFKQVLFKVATNGGCKP